MKTCKQCGRKHNRKSFCSNKCKDRWHNMNNPRGMFAHLAEHRTETQALIEERDHEFGLGAQEDGWDGHKNAF